MQALVTRTIASVGSKMEGSGTSWMRTSPAANMTVALMAFTKAPIGTGGETLSKGYRQGLPGLSEALYAGGRGHQERHPRVPDLAPCQAQASGGRAPRLRSAPGSGTAPRGGRRPGRRQRPVLHPVGARRHERRVGE